MTTRHWRPIWVFLMLVGFFGPWVPSCTTRGSEWGNAPHYLSEYEPVRADLSTGDLGPGYFHPDVYFGFETIWIYLLGFAHFAGLHTLLFFIGLGAVLVILYSLMSLSIYFHGTEVKTSLLERARRTAILCVIIMTLGGLQFPLLSDKSIQLWHRFGYIVTFTALIVSTVVESKNLAAAQSVNRPTLWLGASGALIVSSLFLPGVWIFTRSLPSSTQSPSISACEALNAFVIPADEWDRMDSTSLEAWVESSPAFDNFGSAGQDDVLIWYAYTHSVSHVAYFQAGRLQSILVTVVDSRFSLGEAFTCYGEPDAYIAYQEMPKSDVPGLLLVQFWYPAEGVVLSNSETWFTLEPTAVDERLPMEVYFVQPGSIQKIAAEVNLGIQKSDGSFPWVQFIKPWPGSLQDIQVVTE